MPNHFHVLVRIKSDHEAILKLGSRNQPFSNLFNSYAKAFNKAYSRTGSLFEKRFHRHEVTNESHLCRLVVYIHQNPTRHGFTTHFRGHPFSSYRQILSPIRSVVRRREVLQWFGDAEGFRSAHDMWPADPASHGDLQGRYSAPAYR
jgi:putative transposase